MSASVDAGIPPQADTPSGRHPPGTHTPCPVHAGIHTPPCPVYAGIDRATAVMVRILLESILILRLVLVAVSMNDNRIFIVQENILCVVLLD